MEEDKIIIQNLLAFMDKVTTTGRQEVKAYVECVSWLEVKLMPEMKVDNKKEEKIK